MKWRLDVRLIITMYSVQQRAEDASTRGIELWVMMREGINERLIHDGKDENKTVAHILVDNFQALVNGRI